MANICNTKRVLHISTWYPNKDNSKEALWIKRHIDALNPFCENEVWHIRTVENSSLAYSSYSADGVRHRLVYLPTSRWFIVEIVTFFQLLSFMLFNRASIRKADVINFHIAYPSLTYWKFLKCFIKQPVVITEHWSAYHFNFGVKKKLPKIQAIFKLKFPVIAVSKALVHDIEKFSGASFPCAVIYNVVNTNVFKFEPDQVKKQTLRFFMVSQWKYPKDPFSIINTFNSFLADNPNAELIIAGYGVQEQEIKKRIGNLKLQQSISFIGRVSSEEIAYEMNKATAYIHLSSYETFSVVCAEAICCGCPVIASNVGGIKEFINSSNGVLLNNANELYDALKMLTEVTYPRLNISKNAHNKFSYDVIGKKYFNYLLEQV